MNMKIRTVNMKPGDIPESKAVTKE